MVMSQQEAGDGGEAGGETDGAGTGGGNAAANPPIIIHSADGTAGAVMIG